jgi:glycosyltransferase involved in cell wall biosynthesis
MKQRLAIITEIIAPYRIPVFNALAEHAEVEPHVIFLSETDRSLRNWHVYKEEIQFSYEVLPSLRKRIGKLNVLLNSGIPRALRNARPELILCGGYNYLASWQAALWARHSETPFLMWVESNAHDQRHQYGAVEYLKKKILRWCDAYVVPGRMSREYLTCLGAAPDTIYTAPNAVDNAFYSRAASSIRANSAEHRCAHRLPDQYFLYAGRLVPAKGVFDLLQAYALLSPEVRSQFGLVFAGSGEAESELRTKARAISPGTVLFPGFAQRENLAIFYTLADILLFPTHSDPWGLVVNEAMVCGLPIICSSVAGCSADLVEDGVNGLLVPPGDVARLASSMDVLARNPQMRSQMSRNSLERIANYSPIAWAEGVAQAVRATRNAHHG